jgi:hypothetical protein
MSRSREQKSPLSALLHSLDVRLQPLAGGWAIDLTLPEQASLCSGNGEPLPATSFAGVATHRLLLLIDEVPAVQAPTPRSVSSPRRSRRSSVKGRSSSAGKR